MFCWPCILVWSLYITKCTHNLLLYVYFYSLHVLGSHVSIIRRIIVSMWHLVYVTLCRWPSGMQNLTPAFLLLESLFHIPVGLLPLFYLCVELTTWTKILYTLSSLTCLYLEQNFLPQTNKENASCQIW